MEVISLALHSEEYSEDVTTGWEGKYKTEAGSLLSGLEKFEFIVTFLTVYRFLSHLAGITVKLQKASIDIIEAYNMVDEVKSVYENLRETAEKDFGQIYDHAVRMSAQVVVEPAMPRSAGRQKHRANAPAGTVNEYYLRNLAIPLLEHIISEFEARFSPLSVTSSLLLGLVPSVLCSQEEALDLSRAVDIYKDDLPSPELLDQEVKHWKLKWQGKPGKDIPESCAQAIKDCDPVVFPNISMLLKIACTLPVTSCECERSASTLRRLNTFMRASMKQDRLSSHDLSTLTMTCLWILVRQWIYLPIYIRESWNWLVY